MEGGGGGVVSLIADVRFGAERRQAGTVHHAIAWPAEEWLEVLYEVTS